MDECEDGIEEELMDGLRKEHFRWVEVEASGICIGSWNNFVTQILSSHLSRTKLDEFSEILWTAYQRHATQKTVVLLEILIFLREVVHYK